MLNLSDDGDAGFVGWLVALLLGACGALAVVAVWWLLRPLLWRVVWPLVRWHPWTAAVIAVSLAVLAAAGPDDLVTGWVLAGLGLVAWWAAYPASFERVVRARARSGWRREWVYRRRWRQAMFLSGLGSRFDGGEVLARLRRVRSRGAYDLVAVRLAIAQEPRDWERVSERLAQSFGALGCRVRAVAPGRVVLEFTTRRHDAVVPALPVPVSPDLAGLPIGRRGDGAMWRLRLAQTHVLVAGATGSGKGSVVWSLVRSLASAVAGGWVQLWVIDPKGGMEFAAGEAMFARFAVDPEAIGDLLEDATTLLHERASRLRGVTRQHTPSRRDPTVVVIVDEMAALSGYEHNAELRRRIGRSLGILLSQGRAVGVHVVAALQDPRKEVIPFRDLFPTRICLRMTEAEQVDWVLGRGSHERGARAERISEATPGCGYVLLDGQLEPTWVRAGWVTDDDITDLAGCYPAPRYAEVIDVTEVVDDQADDEGEAAA